jgi:hypothetical protein
MYNEIIQIKMFGLNRCKKFNYKDCKDLNKSEETDNLLSMQ